jgi:membrane protein
MRLGMSWRELFRSLRNEWKENRVTDVAGMVTFAGVLSLFPFLLFLVALGSVLIDPAQAQALVDQLATIAPADVTRILGERLQALGRQESRGLVTVSALAAIWSASGGMTALTRALNTIHDVKEARPGWMVRVRAIGMTLFAAALALTAALLVAVAPVAGQAIGGMAGQALTWLRLPVAGLLMMFLWACLYTFLPDVKQRFRFFTPGSVAGVALWVIASWGFSRYVSSFGRYEVAYGALGGVIVLLLWMWISALALLLGAEINAIVDRRRRAPEEKAPVPAGSPDLRPRPRKARAPERPVPALARAAAAVLAFAVLLRRLRPRKRKRRPLPQPAQQLRVRA